jgi:hypothetical protein
MPRLDPPNESQVRKVVETRLSALASMSGATETVTVEWRGTQLSVPVISMPVELLHYNPASHRIRAQVSTDPARKQDLDKDAFGALAQGYLHSLLMGDPANPSERDPSFTALMDDLRAHGQSDPGIITRAGVLVNGNTRRAALKELGEVNIRVGVLPPDAGLEDCESIELSLQLRKDHKRDYSFMNFLLAIDERAVAGHLPAKIQSDFRIKATTYERSRWILQFVRDSIRRSQVTGPGDKVVELRLVDFETHQGKLEELYRAYCALKPKSSDAAEALREQRLLGLLLNKSKTDLRLIEPDFAERYLKALLEEPTAPPPLRIPGTTITVEPPGRDVVALQQLTTRALQAKSIERFPGSAEPSEVAKATAFLGQLTESMDKALDRAGRQGRVVKRRFAPADRLSDACDHLELAVAAVADARAAGEFAIEDVEDTLATLRTNLEKLAAIMVRGTKAQSETVAWLRTIGNVKALPN